MTGTPRFEGTSAIVTGAGSGIGRRVALDLARDGAGVVAVDLELRAATAVVGEIVALGGRAESLEADVSVPEAASAAVVAAEALGPLRLAVNNAGMGGTQAPVADYPREIWDRVMAVNLDGVFFGLQAQIAAMTRNGGGSIVNVTSMLGTVGRAGSSAYVASKHAVNGLTKAAALEYGGMGVRVNAVAPGFINTPILTGRVDTSALAAEHAVGRLGTDAEVSAMVCFLLSEEAGFITGTVQLVDGGYTAR